MKIFYIHNMKGKITMLLIVATTTALAGYAHDQAKDVGPPVTETFAIEKYSLPLEPVTLIFTATPAPEPDYVILKNDEAPVMYSMILDLAGTVKAVAVARYHRFSGSACRNYAFIDRHRRSIGASSILKYTKHGLNLFNASAGGNPARCNA